MDNFQTLIKLNDEIDRKIIFAIVNPDMCNPVNKPTLNDGITYFPTEDYFRQWRINRGFKGVIWLQELVNKNCKKCYGKGNTGEFTHQTDVAIEDIARKINTFIDDKPEIIPGQIIKMLNLPSNMQEPLEYLILKLAAEEVTADQFDNWETSLKYAKVIKQDFVIKEVQWCKAKDCFLQNYFKRLEEVRREIKFSIN